MPLTKATLFLITLSNMEDFFEELSIIQVAMKVQILWNLNIHYQIHKNLPVSSSLCKLNLLTHLHILLLLMKVEVLTEVKKISPQNVHTGSPPIQWLPGALPTGVKVARV
jgi:hypothetical protein